MDNLIAKMQQIDEISKRGRKIDEDSIEKLHNPKKFKPCSDRGETVSNKSKDFTDW